MVVETLSDSECPDCTCYVRTDQETFLSVYSGKMKAESAILSGKVRVDNWAYRELGAFVKNFEFSSKKWEEFFHHRRAVEELQSLESRTTLDFRAKPVKKPYLPVMRFGSFSSFTYSSYTAPPLSKLAAPNPSLVSHMSHIHKQSYLSSATFSVPDPKSLTSSRLESPSSSSFLSSAFERLADSLSSFTLSPSDDEVFNLSNSYDWNL